MWQRADRADLPDPTRPDHPVALYDVNVTPYESLLIGLFAVFRGPENDICMAEGVPKLMDLELGYSRDGFAVMAAGDEPGRLVTRPLSFSGAYLFVNAACADGSCAPRFWTTGAT